MVAGRVHPKTEGLIGFFLNILVMRVDLSGTPRWEAQQHHPLFQVMFVYQNFPHIAPAMPGMMTSVWVGERRLGRYDLMLELWERPHGLSGHFEYSTELFEAGRIEELRAQFAALLRSLVARGGGAPTLSCHQTDGRIAL